MLYKCNHCNYFSNRLSNLRRHEKKKNPCYNKIEVNTCNIEETINNYNKVQKSQDKVQKSQEEVQKSLD